MCGIVGFRDKTGGLIDSAGRLMLAMLEALACRGPDGAGIALIGRQPPPEAKAVWTVRIAGRDEPPFDRLKSLGRFSSPRDDLLCEQPGRSKRFQFAPEPGVSAGDFERAVGARRGGLEILSLGHRLDLVKQVGSPAALEAAYAVSTWTGPLAIGHTRLSTESRIDLSHSQPFWVHGTPDLATVHNGHVTNYHQLRRRYEQQGVTFYTDNDSEVIGVYLRDRMEQGRSLAEALADSVTDLDGAFNYLVASPEGLGVVRDRYGFRPTVMMLVETDQYIAVATEEIALRRAFPGDYSAVEPPPGSALFYPMKAEDPGVGQIAMPALRT